MARGPTKSASSKRGTQAKPAATGALRRGMSKGPSKQDPRTGKPQAHNVLATARQELARLQQEDPETGDWSVKNCAAMLRYWQGVFVEADAKLQDPACKGGDRLRAQSDRHAASKESGEWEKRKAGAMMSLRVDMLRDVLRRLDEQDALSDELLEIEE